MPQRWIKGTIVQTAPAIRQHHHPSDPGVDVFGESDPTFCAYTSSTSAPGPAGDDQTSVGTQGPLQGLLLSL